MYKHNEGSSGKKYEKLKKLLSIKLMNKKSKNFFDESIPQKNSNYS